MRKLTSGVLAAMHTRVPEGGGGPGGPRGEPVTRDVAGRVVNGGRSSDPVSRVYIGMSPAQRDWVEAEAARRRVPKTVILRELLDRALGDGAPRDAVHDVSAGGHVEGAVDLGTDGPASAAGGAGA